MLYSKLIGQRKMRMYWRGKMGFCPFFVKILAQCLCFETIKYRILILKFDLKKNQVTSETQHYQSRVICIFCYLILFIYFLNLVKLD